jgi:thymidylate synthase (FAD)
LNFTTEPLVDLVNSSSYPVDDIAYAARTCYNSHSKSTEESDKKLVKGCVKSGHLSVLEHSFATFEIECSRACSHQLVRHRHFSYAQQSQRYVEVDDNTYFYMPLTIQQADTLAKETYSGALENALADYANLIARGIPKEDARYVLPNATTTAIVMTGNFRSWREFIQKRSIKQAQLEIRLIAFKVWEQLNEECPEVFSDIEVG